MRVERPDEHRGRQVAEVVNGWFVLDVPNLSTADLVKIEAFDAEGRRVGHVAELQGIVFVSLP